MIWGRFDPRSKVFFAVSVSAALSVASWQHALIALPGAVLLAATAGLGAKRGGALLRAVLVLWLLSFLANAFFVPGERLGPEGLGILRPTREGIVLGAGLGARLAALACVSAWMAGTTRLFDFATSVEWGARRWPRLRRRLHRWLFPATLALRLLPLFVAEGGRLLEVDRLRRGPRSGFRGVVRAAGLAPLWVLMVVERAESLAVALSLRGYRPDADRGFARAYRLGARDVLLGALAVASFALLSRAG